MAANREEGNPRRKTNSLVVKLCDLPDAILVAILSFLPTKYAVATSLLSRKWRYLWTSITNLQCSERLMFKKRRSHQFINFMDRAMVLRDGSSLVSFFLECEIHGDASHLNTWISKATLCNVKELSLHLFVSKLSSDYLLPCCIFECQSLVKLYLGMEGNAYIRMPPLVNCLTRLKSLTLESIILADDESAEKLLSSPLLEELTLVWCDWENIRSVNVYAPKLKVLIISDGHYNYADRKVCFIGDNLKSFKYVGNLSNEYHICASSMHLSDVEVNVQDYVNYTFAAKRCYKILNGFSGVQNLTLPNFFIECLEHEPELLNTIPLFERLTQLNLGAGCLDSVVLMKIFEQCPYLECLSIDAPYSTSPQLNPTPLCFQTHLKRITFRHYYPEKEDSAISTVLNSAAVLEELVIRCRTEAFCDDTIEEYQDELNRGPKVSKDCKISVVRPSSRSPQLNPVP